jgi:hypothetical protein
MINFLNLLSDIFFWFAVSSSSLWLHEERCWILTQERPNGALQWKVKTLQIIVSVVRNQSAENM